MTRSFLTLLAAVFTPRRGFKGVPFSGNAHLMRDIGCTPKDAPRFDFFHSMRPR